MSRLPIARLSGTDALADGSAIMQAGPRHVQDRPGRYPLKPVIIEPLQTEQEDLEDRFRERLGGLRRLLSANATAAQLYEAMQQIENIKEDLIRRGKRLTIPNDLMRDYENRMEQLGESALLKIH